MFFYHKNNTIDQMNSTYKTLLAQDSEYVKAGPTHEIKKQS